MPSPAIYNPPVGRNALFNLVYDSANDRWVPIASNAAGAQQVTTAGSGVAPTDRSIAATTTSQQLMPANAARMRFFISNDSTADVYVRFGASAATAAAGGGNIKIAAGGKLELAGVASAIQIIASAAAAVTAYEW